MIADGKRLIGHAGTVLPRRCADRTRLRCAGRGAAPDHARRRFLRIKRTGPWAKAFTTCRHRLPAVT
ncbi:hypothetical protein [Streptomyces sp. NPDC002133]|uniref:hypothetical protein n=1 Tax=Streptomyces sp. NPDC002133 TaxID=3154409 RepID=UPI003330C9B2